MRIAFIYNNINGEFRPHLGILYVLSYLEKNTDVRITNYGEYLALHPPDHEVQIHDNSSWSCVHGVERWRSDCGCNTGYQGDWNQRWRAPLRESLDWLRYKLIHIFNKQAPSYFSEPWTARNHYIDVLHDRSPESKNTFLKKHGKTNISDEEKIKALMLLEMQRNAMLMYTSCGWFFDEISGIEPVQILNYAARAIELAQEIAAVENLEETFLETLSEAQSNIDKMGNGADIYMIGAQEMVMHVLKMSGLDDFVIFQDAFDQ